MSGKGTPWVRFRRLAWLVLRTGSSLLLLVLALKSLPLHLPTPRFGFAWIPTLLVVGAGALTSVLIEAYRLRCASGSPAAHPYSEWVGLYLRSRPWTFLLPGGLAAEAAIGLSLAGKGWDVKKCLGLLAGNRLWGLGGWCLVMAIATGAKAFPGAMLPALLRSQAVWLLGTLLTCSAGMVLVWPLRTRGEEGFPGRAWNLAKLPLSALGAVAAGTLSCFLICRLAGAQASLLGAATFQAFLMLGMVLPISLAGLGLQEFLLVHGGFFPIGTPALLGYLTLSLHAQRILPAAIGGIMTLRHKAKAPDDPGVDPT